MTATTTKPPPADPLAQIDALEAKRRAKAKDAYTALVCEIAHLGKSKRSAKVQLDVCEAAGKGAADLRADLARASDVLARLKLAQEHESRWAAYESKTAEWRRLQAELKAETKRLEAAIEAAATERRIAHARQAETNGARAELDGPAVRRSIPSLGPKKVRRRGASRRMTLAQTLPLWRRVRAFHDAPGPRKPEYRIGQYTRRKPANH